MEKGETLSLILPTFSLFERDLSLARKTNVKTKVKFVNNPCPITSFSTANVDQLISCNANNKPKQRNTCVLIASLQELMRAIFWANLAIDVGALVAK